MCGVMFHEIVQPGQQLGDREILIVIATVVFYALPILIAAFRRCKRFTSICEIHLFFGWTIIGWAIGIVWALTGEPESF
jgi:Na+/H+-dicarboxylate symporter